MSRPWLLASVLLVSALLLAVGCSAPPRPKRPSARSQKIEVLGGRIDGRRWLSSTAAAAQRAGASALEPVAAAVLSEGDQIGSFVSTPTAQCALAIARAGPSVRDVDLFIYSDEGERLAADEGPEAGAAVMICPPHPRRVYVAARVVTGAGMVAVGMQSLEPSKAQAVSRAVRARGLPDQDTGQLSAWPGLETKIREHRQAIGSSWVDVRRILLPLEPRAATAVSVPLPARSCLDVLVVPNDHIHGVRLTAFDALGHVIARAATDGRDRALVLCSEVEQVVNLQLRPRGSSGVAAVIIGRSPKGAALDLARHTPVAGMTPLLPLVAATERHEARMQQAGYAKAKSLAKLRLAAGRSTQLSVGLERGCSRVDVIGGAPLGPFAAELWSEDGRRLARGRGGETATLMRCGPATAARVEIAPLERGGTVAVELRRDPQAPKLLIEHSVAGGRLLAWLEAVGGGAHPRRAKAATAVDLHAGRSEQQRLTVPAGKCVDLVAALGEQGRGLELSLRDADGVLARATGDRLTSLRHCATGEALRLRLDISLRSGSGTALLLRR